MDTASNTMDKWEESTRPIPPLTGYLLSRLPSGVVSPFQDSSVATGCVDWLMRNLQK